MLEEYKEDRSIWEENIDSINLRSDLLVMNRVIDLLGDVTGKSILDVGCGSGKMARKLALKGANVTGIDIIPEQIHFARKIEEERKQGIVYLIGDIFNLKAMEVSLGHFDIIISTMTHLYFSRDDFKRSFYVIDQLLKPGGRFIYGDVHPSRNCHQNESDQIFQADLPTVHGPRFKTSYFLHSQEFLMNAIHEADLQMHRMYEPLATKEEVNEYPSLFYPFEHGPQYIIVDISKS